MKLSLFWGWRRCCILVETPCLDLWQVAFRQSLDHEMTQATTRSRDRDPIAGFDLTVWFCTVVVDQNISTLTRALRF